MKVVFPVRIWVRQGLLFSVTLAVYVMLSSYMEGLSGILLLDKFISSFFVFFLICMGNGIIYVFMKAENLLRPSLLAIGTSFMVSMMVLYLIHGLHVCFYGSNHASFGSPRGQLDGGKLYIYLALQASLMNCVVLIWQNLVIVQHIKMQIELENSRLAKAESEATNQLLKQQIHPHFLFNALSTLRALIRKDGNTAEDYLLRLADFLRVSVSADPVGLSSLRQEVKTCRDYLEMQKMRFKEALCFNIELNEELLEHGVLPLFSLQSLAENAIKHNQLTREAPLYISVRKEGNWITVKNNIRMKSYTEESTRSGLVNLAERYRILAEEKMEIIHGTDFFMVKIKILDDEYSPDRR